MRLTSARGESVVDGAFVSAEALRFKTPTHEQHGALPCDVCVSIGSDSWTVNPLNFQVRAGAESDDAKRGAYMLQDAAAGREA